jgi:UPF0176 protein
MTMPISNIAGYKFITLTELPALKTVLLAECRALEIKGTILLSPEGINISLAGPAAKINQFKTILRNDSRFADMTFRESQSEVIPFQRLKIKLKNEIITMRHPEIFPEENPAASISPQEFKRWLDENRDITILDTRNDYEVRFGTFANAINLHIKDFCEFPDAAEKITDKKPVVMFCTGGIRCEKAAIHLKNAGFPEVYQLQGGILNYFAEVGGAHYDGECYVFDERIALNAALKSTGTTQCLTCHGPVKTNSCESCHSLNH